MIRHFFIVLICLLPLSAFSGSYFLDQGEMKGVSSGDGEVLYSLFKKALASESGEALEMDVNKAKFHINFSIYKLGSAYILTATRKDHAGEEKSSKIKVKNIENADTAVGRLAKAVVDGSSKPKPQVGKVLDSEEKKMKKRIESHENWLVSFGPGWMSNLGDAEGTVIGLAVGKAWQVNPNVNLSLKTGFTTSTDSDFEGSFSYMIMGARYYLSADDISPFVGVGFGYGWSSRHLGPGQEEDSSGFALEFTGGMTFFRTSNIHLDLELGYRMITESNSEGSPGAFTLGVGLYF